MQNAEVVDQYPRPPPYFAQFTVEDKMSPPRIPNSDELLTYGGTVPKSKLIHSEDGGDEKIVLKRYIASCSCYKTDCNFACRLISTFLDTSLEFVGNVPNSEMAISEKMIELDHKINQIYEFLDKYKYNEVIIIPTDVFYELIMLSKAKVSFKKVLTKQLEKARRLEGELQR
jgi:hypothetical protein